MTKAASAAKKPKSDDEKSDGGVNKAELIREALTTLGLDTPGKTVQEYVANKGEQVAAAQISNIRTKLKGGGKKRAKKAKAAAAASSSGAPKGEGTVSASDLIQARIMADKVGGVERAKVLLDLLNKLR